MGGRKRKACLVQVGMMPKTGNYVFAYDISLNTERVKVDKVLKEYGFRVQKSVFECMLSETDREKLIKKLAALNLKSGFVKVYKQEYCFNSKVVGAAPLSQEREVIFFVG